MLPHFFSKDVVERDRCLAWNGKLVLESYADLRNRLIAEVGRAAAAAFAEPIVTVKDGMVEIAWYCEQADEPRPLQALDPERQSAARHALAEFLGSLAPLLQSDIGPLLARALYVADVADIMVTGSGPLLVRWGIVPDRAIAQNPAAAARHFAATLGPFAPFPAPKIDSSPAPRRTPVEPPPVPSPRSPIVLKDHRPVMIAAIVAAGLVLLLTLPGVLATTTEANFGDRGALERARQITEAMKDKVDAATKALNEANCEKDGSISPKNSNLPPVPVPIRSGSTPPVPAIQDAGMELVSRRATEAVVFIFTCNDEATLRKASKKPDAKLTPCPKPTGAKDDAAASPDLFVQGWGSGFFVAPNLIATNTHVVEGAAAVRVAGRSFGRIVDGKVEAATHKTSAADPDFAVVRVDVLGPSEPIELTTTATRLENVVSAGYPGVVTETADAQLDRLFAGDPNAVPELVTFPGFVTLTLNQEGPVPLIISSATIGHGNSGGPLLDLCGRAVGVNTLGWSGKEMDSGYKVNVAEASKALSTFLSAHKVAHKVTDNACKPGAQADNSGTSPAGPH